MVKAWADNKPTTTVSDVFNALPVVCILKICKPLRVTGKDLGDGGNFISLRDLLSERAAALDEFSNFIGNHGERNLLSIGLTPGQRLGEVQGLLSLHLCRHRRLEWIHSRL